ncbi:hypothetical protein M409DRAFT_17962 [Zasmidium cellare ATCC 36951]|uniref:DUF7918 domain-containing protein n=1 Tax=Zasmidium cellare ATCC 36951 TaxID=1080233 RepID=A0A6A6D273_ZASCE|nr:uncharacterized protein M409DRAFT_17962 [Zasmidium cellare ATCC 36951]KAF2171726.1 hypothetical protein M409DRAFT_17962 [Zasmidium cellare ATCC 36951]
MKHDHVLGVSAYINHGNTNATRYVEATPGATFTASVVFDYKSFPYPNDDIDCAMYLDGENAVSYIRKVRSKSTVTPFDGCTEVTPSGTYMRKFKFQELATNDGFVQEGLREKLKSLGTISIKLRRCRAISSKAPLYTEIEDVGKDSVPEKGLKGRAISTQATLGTREKVQDVAIQDVAFPYGTRPFAEFTFKYRSRKDLQVEGIIPRSPSPVPLEDRDPATLNADELRQLLERRNEELKKFSNIKTEKRERPTPTLNDNDDDELIITEHSSKRRRTSHDSGIEVVDLTDD